MKKTFARWMVEFKSGFQSPAAQRADARWASMLPRSLRGMVDVNTTSIHPRVARKAARKAAGPGRISGCGPSHQGKGFAEFSPQPIPQPAAVFSACRKAQR